MVAVEVEYPALADAILLCDVPAADRAAFLAQCTRRHYEHPTPVLIQNSMPEGVFFVAEGSVEISYISPGGHQIIIAHAGPPRVIGAVESAADEPCAATCTVFPGTTLFFCPIPVFLTYLQDPTFLRNFARITHIALLHDNASKAVDQFYTAEQRICSYLLKLAGESLTFSQSQSYLANAVGCTRQTVNKELSTLKDMGIIAIAKGDVTILNRTGLIKRIADLDERKTGTASRPILVDPN